MSEQSNTAPRPDAAVARRLKMMKARNKRISLITVTLCLLVILLASAFTGLYFLQQWMPVDDGNILPNVYVGGVNIGGLSLEDATRVIQLSLVPTLSSEDMVVHTPDDSLRLTPECTGVTLNVEALVSAAYSYGRGGSKLSQLLQMGKTNYRDHHIALLPYLTLDMTYIEDTVTAFCNQYQTELIQPSFRLTGERPTYNKVNNSHVEHQTLIITMGMPKSQLNPDDVVRKILDGYSMLEMEQEYEAPIAIEPEHLSAQAIFDELCQLPQDAVIDSNTFAVTPEVYGYGFNVENVQRQIDRAEFGQTLQIKLGFLLPDITVSALNSNLFKDTLASYVSRCTDGTNAYRDQNLKQSCQAINGYILKVGESFDLDEVLGPRTYTRGYRHAPTYSGSTTTSFGGGINQTASTLYYCALMAGLTINERHSHRYAVGYTPLGTDASLSTYGAESLVFTNNTTAPIRILATANGSTVSITFLGTETREQTWKVETEVKEIVTPSTIYQYMDRDNVFNYLDGQIKQTSQIGYTIEVYMCKYDATTGALLEKKLLLTTRYESRDQIVIKIIEDGQQIIT